MGLRERKKAKTMALVQKHALRLFREQGYKATTVEQIAEAAEISYSTFFRYFAGKEEVLIRDNYDPLLISTFEAEPLGLSPLQALKNAMLSEIAKLSDEELETMRERNQLIYSIPELRSAMLKNMSGMMQLLAELLASRTGREKDDFVVQTLAGAVVGVNISVMLHYAEHLDADFGTLLGEALDMLEQGFPL
ncbi:TetR family transcriptional regulator [Paenibacillus albidus]|uniref:acyl-CoA-like ligand-binding transcription factor n=1 Tax=Paenibacillus albidus TaxID=2041023 RepID=UPI001BE86CD0|nr:TetR family transcriptional regulator [Paenibacillus albidus]MBT2291439.1 TetR family transcriptional regulator [Paenibacillus albidus]